MYSVTKSVEFCYGHRLLDHAGPCRHPHGHNAIAEIEVSSPALDAMNMVIDFAEFFRETLRKHGEFGTLAEELDYVDKYLEFERARLGHRLQISREVEPAGLEVLLPVLVIQPLVENAVNHGLAPQEGGGYVSVSARLDGDDWLILVEDNGVGIDQDRLRGVLEPGVGSGLGMGLSNVNQRLVSIYGPAYALRIDSKPGHGTRVSVRIPSQRPI